MATRIARTLAPTTVLVLLLACGAESPTTPEGRSPEPRFHSFASSEWSEPVSLPAPVNSVCQDQTPTLSRDELSLYFHSDRPGGMGNLLATGCMDNTDLWVARRSTRGGAWESATNLGATVNTVANEGAPELSDDGHLLFFASSRPDGFGQNDLYLSRRDDPKNDLGWGAPMNLGPGVNDDGFQSGPSYRQNAEDGAENLYFYSGASNGAPSDIYYIALTRDGETRGPAVYVAELNLPGIPDGFPTVRADGREIMFNSGRDGVFDLWVSTRRSVHDPWSAPENLGAPVNTSRAEFQPNLSHDGRTLLFIAGGGRGGLGQFDIWMSTRSPSGN